VDHATLQTPAVVLLMLTLVVASVTDLRSRVIPNWLVALTAAAGMVLAIAGGKAGTAVLMGILAASPFLAAALVKPEGMGMGDVKLAGVMGICLGSTVWLAIALALGLAGLAGVLISLGQRLPPARTTLPLAPFMALGAGVMLAASMGPLQ